MKLFEYTRYNPIDDEVQQTLVFANSIDEAYELVYGYEVKFNDPRRSYWNVKEVPIKKGIIELSF